MIGLVTAGPWLTMTGARIMARRTSRAGALIAARRLADDPRAAFRAVSGLVLALFITTVAVADITTQDAKDLGPIGGTAAAGVLVDELAGQPLPPAHGRTKPTVARPRQLPASLLARLSRIAGVRGVIEVGADSTVTTLPRTLLGPGVPAGVVSCAQLARVPALGRCPAGAAAVAFPRFVDNAPPGQNLDRITWPAEDVSGPRLTPAAWTASTSPPTDPSQRSSKPGPY